LPPNKENSADNIEILASYLTMVGKIWPFLAHLDGYRLNWGHALILSFCRLCQLAVSACQQW